MSRYQDDLLWRETVRFGLVSGDNIRAISMSNYPLSKSYVDTRNPKKPYEDTIPYRLWDEARKKGFVGNILNIETGEMMTNVALLDLVSEILMLL